MEFNPVGILVVMLGILAVIIGIRGSNNAVFETLTGHTTTGATTTPNQSYVSTEPISSENTALPTTNDAGQQIPPQIRMAS